MSTDREATLHEALNAWAESDAPIKIPGRELRGRQAAEAGQAVLRQVGRPSLSGQTGAGRSPRRQVRLDLDTSERLDSYAAQTGRTPSDIIRDAVRAYLHAGGGYEGARR